MRPRQIDPVKLVISIFTNETNLFPEALSRLEERFGAIDCLSETLDFSSTDYYEGEFGTGLKRKIASFEELINIEDLAPIKLFTNALEAEYLKGDNKRRVNIDPGFMALEKFVLASCKNFSHRIYLKEGVFADLTMIYEQGRFRSLEWTYPDYNTDAMKALLKQIRKRYAFKIGKGLKRG
ncbi:MAG: DUF4416 family protein [Deltaproteobacteria bacterium]|nr:DUF4416 family protein [Deltaproteobacteria bacterium]